MRACLILSLICGATVGTMAMADEIVFPPDPRAVLDVKRDFGAVGDGVADDTEALQKAIESAAGVDHSRIIYLPKGTYRITRTLTLRPPGDGREGSMVGPWLWGQDRSKTVIRLDDGAEGFDNADEPREVIRGVSRPDGAKMNADFFDRTLVNFTLDTGDNRGAVGMKFYSNNTGHLHQVTIRGNGAVGLDLGFNDQNGPLLVQDVEIIGYAVGIRTNHIINAQTLSRVTVRDASKVGLEHRGQVLAVERLHVINAPLGVDCGDRAVLTLIDSTFEASPNTTGPAIRIDKGRLYAARIKTSGFGKAIAGGEAPGGDVAGPHVEEYACHPAITLGEGSPKSSLGIEPRQEPKIVFPTRAEDWVCANDYGAKAGDKEDDAPAIQRAIDAAAEKGAAAVYLLGGKRGDPNWYHMKQDVRIHGSVRLVMGFGQVRILGGSTEHETYPENLAKFIIDDEAASPDVVGLAHLQVFSPWPSFGVEVKAKRRVVVCRSTHSTILAREGSTVFATNTCGHACVEPGATLYARQWNTERGPKLVGINTRNTGGTLWILGMKTEAAGTKIASLAGGRTEVLGVLNYNNTGVRDDTPFFRVQNAALSVTGYREVHFGSAWWPLTVHAVQGDQTHQHGKTPWQTWTLLRTGD